jgi:membrane AbrB-like protein
LKNYAYIALTLAIGAAGGALLYWARMPLAWMIGALIFVTIFAVAGAPMRMTQRIRQPMVAILGVMLGSAFSPEMAERLPSWWATISLLAVYVLLTTLILYRYFRHLFGCDRVTAFCAGTPGGLNEMVLLLTVLILPFAFVALGIYDRDNRPAAGMSLVDLPLHEWGILFACAVIGFFGARAVRMPAAAVTGPMLVSAAVHLMGWSTASPPAELVAAAQIALGAMLGSRFAGVEPAVVLRAVWISLGATIIMLSLTVVFSVTLVNLVDESISALVLAFAPGGLAEMSLIALALGIEAAFVASHHIIRIVMIVIIAPGIFRRRARDEGSSHS